MEGSKTFAKDFMTRHQIPTAKYGNFSDYETARAHLESISYNVVIKADGLAGGKGVLMPSTKEEAFAALESLMVSKEFGSAGEEVVIEEYLEGDELSFLSFSDGSTIRSLPAAQDHKQVYDDDKGPNTGGMGCYAPAPLATPQLIDEVHRTILQPTIDGMRQEGLLSGNMPARKTALLSEPQALRWSAYCLLVSWSQKMDRRLWSTIFGSEIQKRRHYYRF